MEASRETRRAAAPAAALLALLVLVAGGACGRKTDVRPPELVAPQIVEGVEARNVAEGIRVAWKRPHRYVGGDTMNDLAGFRIERSRDGAAFATLTEVHVGDRERFRKVRRFGYLDTDVTLGTQYLYRVYAFTEDGHYSAASPAVFIVREAPAGGESISDSP